MQFRILISKVLTFMESLLERRVAPVFPCSVFKKTGIEKGEEKIRLAYYKSVLWRKFMKISFYKLKVFARTD